MAILTLFFLSWYLVYALLNAFGSVRCTFWQNPGIFVSSAVPIYVFGGAAVAILPFFFHRAPRSFFRLLGVYAVVSAVFFVIYAVFPVCMQRQAYDGPGLADVLMRLVVGLDQPANCFPSSHCMFATLGFLGVKKAAVRLSMKVGVCLLAVAVCASTILVGQHYLADVVVGIGLAALLFAVVYPRLLPEIGDGSTSSSPQG